MGLPNRHELMVYVGGPIALVFIMIAIVFATTL
jgi:hypothetical protein